MCVAAVVFQPVSARYLQAMEDDNPHGAGVAWQDGNAIRFHRGLTAAEIFEMQESGQMTYPYLLHFRWATHGAKVPELTHPFPTGVRALLGELAGTAPEVLIHNGTWHGWYTVGRSRMPPELRSLVHHVSDTAVAAFLAAYNSDILDEVHWATAHAMIGPDGLMHVVTRGTWSDHEGNWYSNLMWLPTTRVSRYFQVPEPLWNWEPEPELIQPVTISWDEYVRAKYGDSVAAEDAAETAELQLEPDFGDIWRDELNIVSEDFGVVNEYLRRINE